MNDTHLVLVVRCMDDHDTSDTVRAWCAAYAVDTIGPAEAWFESAEGADPTVPRLWPNGTFRVHVPNTGKLEYLRERLLPHAGLTVVGEMKYLGLGDCPFSTSLLVAEQAS